MTAVENFYETGDECYTGFTDRTLKEGQIMAKEKPGFDKDDFQEKIFKALKGSGMGDLLGDGEIEMKIIRIDSDEDEGPEMIHILSQAQKVIREMALLNEMQSDYIERMSEDF